MPQPNLPRRQRDWLLYIALGDLGIHWYMRTESRFVHNTTGQAVDVFDARTHGDFKDWHTERREVFTTRWEASQ